MKKLFAILLAMIMVMTLLTACGNKDDKDDDNKTTSTSQEKDDEGNNSENKLDEDKDADDDKDDDKDKDEDEDKNDNKDPSLLKAPSVELKTEKLEIFFGIEYSNGSEMSGTIIMINDSSPAQIYYNIGDEECLFELADSGVITKHVYDENSYSYVQDTNASQEELKKDTDYLITLVSYSGWKFAELNPDMSYRLIDEPDTVNALIYGGSDSSWYELVQNGKAVGYVAVDNKTGIFNCIESSSFLFYTVLPEIEDVEIPNL